MTLVFKSYALSDVGLHREGNEDSGLISSNLVAVADGMGGHAGGEVASKIAIRTLTKPSQLSNGLNSSGMSIENALLEISNEINSEIAAKSKSEPELSGMGTTLTALYLSNGAVELLHIGDSRCYAFSKGKLNQLSYDHTVMQELVDQGRLTPDEVVNHPQRSLLTQALMGDSGVTPQIKEFPVQVGDKFLLCSDGLTSVLSDLEISKIIKKNSGIALVEKLVVETKEKGAPDNVTVIWVEVVEEENEIFPSLVGAANE
jgi:PPM family protein phosphatase